MYVGLGNECQKENNLFLYVNPDSSMLPTKLFGLTEEKKLAFKNVSAVCVRI